jgi:uncharacterized membrane protein
MPRKKPVEVETWHHDKTWTAAHRDKMTFGQRVADAVASGMGSWAFIIIQTLFVIAWMALNIVEVATHRWDPYPFILLNLLFSTQAAYAAPIIMMSQNRSAERDRFQANADFQTNVEAKKDIESLQLQLARIENDKLDKIMELLGDGDGSGLEAALEAIKAARSARAAESTPASSSSAPASVQPAES